MRHAQMCAPHDFVVLMEFVPGLKTDSNGKTIHKLLEVDFVANKGSKRYYIKSAYAITPEKELQEKRSLMASHDSFKKIIVTGNDIKLRRDENGIVTMSIFDFLLNSNSLDY